jgi:hypothetical protein
MAILEINKEYAGLSTEIVYNREPEYDRCCHSFLNLNYL